MNVELTETHWERLKLTARLAAWIPAREHGVSAGTSDRIVNAAVECVRAQLEEWEQQGAVT